MGRQQLETSISSTITMVAELPTMQTLWPAWFEYQEVERRIGYLKERPIGLMQPNVGDLSLWLYRLLITSLETVEREWDSAE